MMTDPISDMLTRIRNANMIKREMVDIPCSTIKLSIAEILKNEGYIREYSKIHDEDKTLIRIVMKYSPKGEPVIHALNRKSLPSRRVYLKSTELDSICGGLGISIISTSQGMLTGTEAKKRNIGGEFVCEVW